MASRIPTHFALTCPTTALNRQPIDQHEDEEAGPRRPQVGDGVEQCQVGTCARHVTSVDTSSGGLHEQMRNSKALPTLSEPTISERSFPLLGNEPSLGLRLGTKHRRSTSAMQGLLDRRISVDKKGTLTSHGRIAYACKEGTLHEKRESLNYRRR